MNMNREYDKGQNPTRKAQARRPTHFDGVLDNLHRITAGCRPDMHEPDEQGVTATVVGKVFDNAGTPNEITVTIRRDGYRQTFSLASLVALARLAGGGREAARRIEDVAADLEGNVRPSLADGLALRLREIAREINRGL